MGSMTEVFRSHLRELWPSVEPYWAATLHPDVTAARAALDSHLAGTPRETEAMLLADRLHQMVDACEGADEERRHVVCAAITYFLEVDDAWPDHTAGGLSDDHRVVRAAELALEGSEQA